MWVNKGKELYNKTVKDLIPLYIQYRKRRKGTKQYVDVHMT